MVYQRTPEEEEERACPFCGQMVLTDGDPREVCDCIKAAHFRALCEALDSYCGEDCDGVADFKPVPGAVMEALRIIAEQVAHGALGTVAAELPDGSTVKIGARKVSRRITVKAEQAI